MLEDIIKKYSAEHTYYGTDKNTCHSYVATYESVFSPFRDKHITLTEIGVSGGYSIQTWLEYFPNAIINAIDINWHTCNFNDWGSRVNKIHCDATTKDVLNFVTSTDIIVDDGSHYPEHQIASFDLLYPILNVGGVYVIEDIIDLEKLTKHIQLTTSNYEVYDLRDVKNRHDDILVVIYK
jgi:hypothetical protein